MIYIRNAKSEEQCKYVLTDGTNIIKKYYEEDEPVDFSAEIQKYEEILKQQQQEEFTQTSAQIIANLMLENADLKTQLQTLAQTIATMQLGGA